MTQRYAIWFFYSFITPLPGGDKAIKEPYSIALSHLYDTYGMDFLKLDISFIKGGQGVVPLTKDKKIKTILKMIDNRINTVMTSSAGRLFDAVSSIINGINAVTFEGEAAIKLEIKADTGIDRVVLSGGCFQNILLLDRTLNKLNTEFKTFIHKNIPTNDGGISLGQAVIAAEKGKNMEL